MLIPLTWGHALPIRRRHDQRTAHVLVVEHDARIRTAVIGALRDRGHAVSSAGTALSGLQAGVEAGSGRVLDLGLPDLLRMLRAVSTPAPRRSPSGT